jgi:hypothetical protein
MKVKKWKIADGCLNGYETALGIKVDDGAETPVCVISVPMGWRENPKWKQRAEENANLIAAAPEMLKTLKKCLKDHEVMLSLATGAKKEAWQFSFDEIKAIINKAEGK